MTISDNLNPPPIDHSAFSAQKKIKETHE